MSNPVPFAVNTLQLTTVSPNSGAAGTSVTFTGAGFGSSLGSGVAWLGSTAGQVVSWSDTQVVATVASTALTGIARIQQNGAWSNALAFTVPAANGVTLMPSMINMMMGDTHAIQALSASGQPVTGLTWNSSDPTVVSLSTDDPPILTALAAGHVTITAGTASADVTVSSPTDFPGGPPLGTVLWSHPGDVNRIVPAVPSPSGVADVFAFQNGGMVQAIRSDGTTAWTANIGQEARRILADFQGGLVYSNDDDGSLVRLDGMTGQPLTLYTPENTYTFLSGVAVHTDGTVFAVETAFDPESHCEVLGIDSATGAQKFSVPVPMQPCLGAGPGGVNAGGAAGGYGAGPVIIAGDGYAYVPYTSWDSAPFSATSHLHLLRISSSGASNDIAVYDWTYYSPDRVPFQWGNGGGMITNGDTGIVLTWMDDQPHMAIINGTGASVVNGPEVVPGHGVIPILQAQDGSFVGTQGWGQESYMVAFDATGGTLWTVPGYYPLIATADGGVIATSDYVSATIFDQNGNAVDQMANMPTYSWIQASYLSTAGVTQVLLPTVNWAASYQGITGGNFSSNGTSVGIARTLEGLLVFAMKLFHFSPDCQWQAPGAGVKVQLTGDALQSYQTEKQQLLAGNYLASTACSNFLIPLIGQASYAQLSKAITQLPPPPELPTPYDGLQTNISCYDAGLLSPDDLSIPNKVSIYKGAPVCGQFAMYKPQHGGVGNPHPNRVTAVAQLRPPAGGTATDIYINTELTKTLVQATIVHEALHNVTGLYDDELETRLGLRPECKKGIDCATDCPSGSICISVTLLNQGCAGTN